MRRISATLVAVLVLVGTVAAVPAVGLLHGVAASEASVAAQSANQSNASANASIAPGERLSGVVGVQRAELDGEVESRAFGLAVARADSDEARAALIAEKVEETRERVVNLSERREALREARANGSMSQGEYAARMAELAARSGNVERTANETADAAEGLPADLLESKGVNASAIEDLRENARNLTGEEVSELAREIAGERPDRADRGADGRESGDGDRGADRNRSDAREDRSESTPRGEESDGTDASADDSTTTTQSTTDSTSAERDRGENAGDERRGDDDSEDT
jgi:hypothetical protein